ncbi:GNAT family N-acetyltransferase [Ilumatobacter sp.]|uniref:GNAT family N-acetyltransferase n=1 Tax=Ilumatobacter sp. TaxID=1967498 RepID=UPI003C363B23
MSTIDINGDDDPRALTDPPDNIEIRTLHSADEMVELCAVFQQVWGSLTELVTIEILMAVSHSGGYISAAFESRGDGEKMLGASVGILARHQGRPALHSHITGLLPGARRSGVGRAMKMHQRRWAAEHDIDWIVWTFDPLVRRNAWFNIEVLGAEAHEYLPSFYGTMTDSINSGDESDRLLMAWPVVDGNERSTREEPTGDGVLVPTPEDIVTLRRTDPAAVARWRQATRDALQGALDRGDRVVGFTADGEYVVESGS